MNLNSLLKACAALCLVAFGSVCQAQDHPNSLWVGGDPFIGIGPVENTDLAGNVFRSIAGTANGIAVDVAGNKLYLGDINSLTTYNLTTLASGGTTTQSPLGALPEDMTFMGGHIWRTDYSLGIVNEIDPATNTVLSHFTPTNASGPVSGPLGIAWDGTDFWISSFNSDTVGKYDLAGALIPGTLFSTPTRAGGIGFDTTDGTLFVGLDGKVNHYSTAGVLLDSFSTHDGRFVDGLEFEGGVTSSVPEPATLALLGLAFAGMGFGRRRQLN
jgi:hypothetical protein